MSQLWQRREHRVDYESMVRLLPSQESDPIDGCTANLSQSGVFVKTPTLCDVGTELLCDLELPRGADPGRLTVHGRVAWVYEPHDGNGGMGIEFVGLTEPDSCALRALAGPPRDEVRQLDVWFDGVEQPVRVEAVPSSAGVKLRTSLPFLQLGSGVSLAGGEIATPGGRGQLSGVELMIDPARSVPFLELTISPAGSSSDRQRAAGRAVGPIIPGRTAHHTPRVAAPTQHDAHGGLEDTWPALESAELLEDDGLDGLEGEQREAEAEQVDDALEVLDGARQELEDEPKDDGALLAHEAAETWQLDDSRESGQLELDLTREQTASALSGEIDLASELESRDMLVGQANDRADERGASLTSEATDGAPERPPKTRLWLAGLALCALVLSWTVHTGLWARLGESDGNAAKAMSAQRVAAASTNLEPDRRGLRSIDKGRAAARTSLHSQGHRRRANGRQGARGLPLGSLDRPRVQRFGNATVLTIPIQGTTDGVQHYEMTKPPGLVVKLPHATARLPLDDYRINQGGFGVVWVRHSAEGLHLRFHFTAKRLQHTLTLGGDRVAVTLSPGD